MAEPLAAFTQGARPNHTTDELRISRSSSDPHGIYIQLVKKGPPKSNSYKSVDRIMHFKVDHADIEDIIVALQYAQKLTESDG